MLLFEGVKVEQKNRKSAKKSLVNSVVSVSCISTETTEYKCFKI